MGRNLVTGGLGFLGSYIARGLLDRGEEAVIFDAKSEAPYFAADLEGKVEIVQGDISNWTNVLDTVKKYGIDSIYHAAGLVTRASAEDLSRAFKVNVGGMMNVLEAARILGVKDVLFTSTCSTYGSIVSPPPATLDDYTLQKPDTMYAVTKVCCEKLGEQYYRQYGVNFRAIRYSMVVGLGRPLSYFYGDWSGVIEVPAQGKPYTAHSDPSIPCSYIYGRDAVRAMFALKDAPENSLRQRVYSIDGFTANLDEVIAAVRKHIPDARINFEADKTGEMKAYNGALGFKVDNTAAFEDFGYKPQYLLDDMVADFIKEVRGAKAS